MKNKFLTHVSVQATLFALLFIQMPSVKAADPLSLGLLTVDQEAKISAPDAATGDLFGAHVAIDGDTMVVGSRFDDDDGEQSGSAYIYVRNESEWTLQAKLTADDATRGDQFGRFVAIDADTVVIGATSSSADGSDYIFTGSAYVFVRDGSSWSQQAKLTADDAAYGDWFGRCVSVDGNTVAVGAPRNDDNGPDSGSAYVFVRSGVIWTQQAKITAPDADADDWFGDSLALSGDTLAVGAKQDDDGGEDSGSVHIFTRTETTWAKEAKLVADDAKAGDRFGGNWAGLAISGDTLLVGAPGFSQPNFSGSIGDTRGSAYVFVRSGNEWSQQAKLAPLDADEGDGFGWSVALDEGTAVVGALGRDIGEISAGSAFIYRRNETNWSQRLEFTADIAAGPLFGWGGTALSNNTLAVGAPHHASDVLGSGSAYVFKISELSLAEYIEYIIEYTSDNEIIFDSEWRSEKMRDAFIYRLEVVLELVTAAEATEDPENAAALYLAAMNIVNEDLIPKTDGLQGVGARTQDDWIRTQEAQDILYPDLLILSDYLAAQNF